MATLPLSLVNSFNLFSLPLVWSFFLVLFIYKRKKLISHVNASDCILSHPVPSSLMQWMELNYFLRQSFLLTLTVYSLLAGSCVENSVQVRFHLPQDSRSPAFVLAAFICKMAVNIKLGYDCLLVKAFLQFIMWMSSA